MAELSKELIEKLKRADSKEELAELLHVENPASDEKDIGNLWDEISRRKAAEERELSLEELEDVAGGADRDWATEGCSATVEPGSWCWGGSDKCIEWTVTYDHPPTSYQCQKCGMWLYEGEKSDGVTPLICKRCSG